MLKLENASLLKTRLVYFITYIFIISFFFENYLKFEIDFARFSIVEIIFISIFLITLLIYKSNFIKSICKFEKKNIFEITIYALLILKLIKYLSNYQNFYNLYELLIWLYVFCIYILFKFYLNNDKNLIYHLENSFIAVSLIISIHIIYSFVSFKLGLQSNGFWTIKDTTYYPYAGTSSINFKSLFRDHNQAAHLVAPGYMFLITRYKDKIIITSLFIFYLVMMYLIKSKFLIVFFGTIGIYIIINKFNFENLKLNKLLLLFGIIGLSIFYYLITHFIIIEKGTINSSNIDLFKHYYFTDFIIPLSEFDIYGSMFLKTKYTAIEVANSYNYIIFENKNYFNHEIVLKNFDLYTDPHSDYFGALANYGVIGFLIFLGLPIYIIYDYLMNFNLKRIHMNSFIYFLIVVMIFIEANIIDLFHSQFIWIIFSMYLFQVSHKEKEI